MKLGASRLPLGYEACCIADTAIEPSASATPSATACPCGSVLMPWASTKVYPYCFLQISQKVWTFWFTVKIFRTFLILCNRWKCTWVLYGIYDHVGILPEDELQEFTAPWVGNPPKTSSMQCLNITSPFVGGVLGCRVTLNWGRQLSSASLTFRFIDQPSGWSVVLRFCLIPSAVWFINH